MPQQRSFCEGWSPAGGRHIGWWACEAVEPSYAPRHRQQSFVGAEALQLKLTGRLAGSSVDASQAARRGERSVDHLRAEEGGEA